MAKQGWVSIHRSIQDNWLWEEKPFDKKSAWIDLILLANHKDNKFLLGNELIEVPAGSFVTSEVKLMGRWGWGKSKLRSYLKLLEQEDMIVKKSDRKKTVIEVVKYSVYQKNEEASVPPPDHKQTSSRPVADHKQTTNVPLPDTNNNVNNDNNDNNADNGNNKEIDNTPKGEMISKPKIDYQKLVNYWNDTCLDLPKVIKLTKNRKQAIRLRLNEFGEDEILRAIDETAGSDFLCGKVNDFTASFDWILKTANLTKILEGNYKNKKNQNNYENQESSNPFLNLLQSGELSNDEVNTIF